MGSGGMWLRPLCMWENLIGAGSKTVQRFECVGESEKLLEL